MSQTMVPAPDVYAGGTGIRHSPMKGGAVKEADKPRQVRKPKAMNATQPAGGKAARTRGSQRDSSQMAAALRGSGEVSTPTRSRPTTTPGRLRRLAPGENANAAFSPIEKKDQFSRSAPLPRNVVSKAGEAGLGGETPSPVQPTGSGNISPPKLVSSAQPAPKSGWGDLPANNGAGPGGGGLGHKQGSYRWPNGKFSGGVGNGNLFPELTQDATSGEGRWSLGSASDGSGGSGGPVAGVSLLKGRRPYMEDEHRVVMNMEAMEGGGGGGGGDGPPTSFFGLFDGHAGGRCSKAVAGTLPQLVAQQPEFAAPGGAGVAAALEKGCAAANREWFKRADRQNLPDGSTGVAALTRGGRLWVANVGDSRAVLGAEGKAVPLSRDHKPSKPQERRRIMQKGGHVMVSMGVHRVNGVLAVSRAFGDKSLRPVIDAEPEVRAHELRPGDEFLVLGTDGLWDMVTNQEAVNVVRRGLADLGVQGCAEMLTTIALRRGSMDNTSAMVVDLRGLPRAAAGGGGGGGGGGLARLPSAENLPAQAQAAAAGGGMGGGGGGGGGGGRPPVTPVPPSGQARSSSRGKLRGSGGAGLFGGGGGGLPASRGRRPDHPPGR